MTSKSCYIMGLPSAGKTTFLAALAFSLQQKKTDTKLQWDNYDGDHQYITNLTTRWLRADPIDRTNISLQQQKIRLVLSDENNNYIVTFPDLSGEIFQSQYKDREMDLFSSETIKECDGILLFINPKNIKETTFISSMPSEYRNNGDDRKERNAIDDPTEVQLVELLQFVAHIRNKPVTLVVVISAWDLIDGQHHIPEEYLKKQVALLWQYLFCNKDKFKTVYYGVSAQGDELDSEEKREDIVLKNENNPVERIQVIDNDGNKCHDISLPLWYAMNIN